MGDQKENKWLFNELTFAVCLTFQVLSNARLFLENIIK